MSSRWQVKHRALVHLLEQRTGGRQNSCLKTYERIDHLCVLSRPPCIECWRTVRPGANWRIGLYEGLALVAGAQVPQIADQLGNMGQFKDGGAFHGAYGPRARAGLDYLECTLLNNPDTRRAYVPIFNTEDLITAHNQNPVLDTPCTLGFGFRIADGTHMSSLEMTVIMRSWDVWWGLPYDVPMFAMLQASVAESQGLPVGGMSVFAMNAHLYDRDRDAARAFTESEIGLPACSDSDALCASTGDSWYGQQLVASRALEYIRFPGDVGIPSGAAPWLKEALEQWHS